MTTTLTEAQRREFTIGVGMIDVGKIPADMSQEQIFKIGDDMIGKIVQTHETFVDFVKTHRAPRESRTTMAGNEIHVWRSVQFRKGQPRGDLYLMEFDGVSASMYNGG